MQKERIDEERKTLFSLRGRRLLCRRLNNDSIDEFAHQLNNGVSGVKPLMLWHFVRVFLSAWLLALNGIQAKVRFCLGMPSLAIRFLFGSVFFLFLPRNKNRKKMEQIYVYMNMQKCLTKKRLSFMNCYDNIEKVGWVP